MLDGPGSISRFLMYYLFPYVLIFSHSVYSVLLLRILYSVLLMYCCSILFMSRSQWPRGLRHELSSPAPTLRSWVRIPLRHGCLCVFCVRFFCFYVVSNETASRPNKRLMRTYHWISLFMSYIKVNKLAYRI
jgi:hypothetical protein